MSKRALKPKKEVKVRIVFLKLGEIDTIGEKFQADVFIVARWREPKLDSCQHLTNVDLSQYWNPLLIVHNILEHTKRKKWQELSFTPRGEAYIVENRRIKGYFSETLELKEFPFDHQSLNVVLTSEWKHEELSILEDDDDISSINVACFVDEQEWRLFDFVECLPGVTTKQFTPNRNIKFPCIYLGCCAVRRAGFFVWNIILIMTLISTICFATFAVKPNLPQNRLQLAITLMLTTKVFKLTTVNSLPKISYQTRLDRFILMCMIFNYIVTIWHAIIGRFEYNLDLQKTLDNWAFIVLVFAYFLCIAVFTLFIAVTYFRRQQVLQTRLQSYEEHASKILGSPWRDQRNQQQKSFNQRYGLRRRNIERVDPTYTAIFNGMTD